LSASALIRAGASHLATAFSTLAADSGTLFHVAHLLAAPGTGITNFGTNPAELVAKGGIAQHEIDRHLTNLGTIQHEAHVVRGNVFAT
jgi:hypothetical protein